MHKINILDIQITFLLEQYMEYINQAREQNLELTSEFVEMAARLVHIKTVSLLPRTEEAEKLKQELTEQLLEYRLCKLIAAELGKLYIGHKMFVREPADIDFDSTYELIHDKLELIRAYDDVRGKSERKAPVKAAAFDGIVKRRIVSVESKMKTVIDSLHIYSKIKFNDLFITGKDRSEIVAIFLAVLELLKSRRITIDDFGILEININAPIQTEYDTVSNYDSPQNSTNNSETEMQERETGNLIEFEVETN